MNPVLDFILRASLLMVVGLIAWRLARHRTAESRCSLLRATFLGLAALPLALLLVPKQSVVLPWVEKPEPIIVDPQLIAAAQGIQIETPTPFPWGQLSWAAFGLLVLVPALLGWWSVRRLWATGTRPDAQVALELLTALGTLGVRSAVKVRMGDTKTPMVFGVRRPHILLPLAFGDWPEAHRRSALLHEAAHIRRFDCAWLAFAGFIRAVYACHPLVWWLSRALRDETELAADERAIRSGVEATDYASALVAIARDLQRPGRLVHSQGVTFMNHRQLDRRVRGALASRRRGFTLLGTLGLLGSALATVLGVSAIQPTLPEQEIVIEVQGREIPPIFEETAADLYGPLDRTVQVAQAKTKQKAKPAVKPKKVVAQAKPKPATAPKVYTIAIGKNGKPEYKVVTGTPLEKGATYTLAYTIAPVAGRPGHYQVAPKAGQPVPVQGQPVAPSAPASSYYKVVAPGHPAPLAAPARVDRIAVPGAPAIAPGSATAPGAKVDTFYTGLVAPQVAVKPAKAVAGVPVLREIPVLGHLYAPNAQSPEDAKKARDIIEKLLQNAKGKPEEEDLKRLLELVSKAKAEAARAADLAVAGKLTTERSRLLELHSMELNGKLLARTREIQGEDLARKAAIERSLLATRAATIRPEVRLEGLNLARTLTTRVGQSDGIIEIVITDEKGKKQIIKVRQDQVKKTITLQRGKDGKVRVIDK